MSLALYEGISAGGVSYGLAYLCLGSFVWPYVKGSRPVGGLEMFRVALYEVHTVLNFGSPLLYFDIQQHRDVILEGVVASSVQPPCSLSVCPIGNRTAQYILPLCGSLYMKGSRPGGFRRAWLTSALGVSCGFM